MAENSFLHASTNENAPLGKISTDRNFTSTAAKDYVNQRREKAAKQTRDEKNSGANTKLSTHLQNDQNYQYTIL